MFSLHVLCPAEPSDIRTREMSDSVAELIRSNVTIDHACVAVPGLTHPSQTLSLTEQPVLFTCIHDSSILVHGKRKFSSIVTQMYIY